MKRFKIIEDDSFLDVVITEERIDEKRFFVAQGVQVDVASQGLSLEEALENVLDAWKIVSSSSL
jgi:predicted RNase H-like HicB family nuclease